MKYVDQFPGTTEAFEALVDCVRVYRREADADPSGLELEVRFGTITAPVVKTGVSGEFVDRTLQLVQTNPSIAVSEWVEMTDFFYSVPSKGERRSRSRYDTDEMRVDTEVVSKKRLAECQLRHGSVAMRVVVSREVPDAACETLVDPTHVRIQHRRTATLPTPSVPTWVVDFSMVWSGSSKMEAEQRQMRGECPQYALELELVDPGYVASHEDAYVACSLALKAADFLPAATTGIELV